MNLFRSEEHVVRWLDSRPAGVTLSVAKLSEMSHAWWSDRLDPDWRPHSLQQNQAILTGLGLTDAFWQLS
jgi:hypothetical protein